MSKPPDLSRAPSDPPPGPTSMTNTPRVVAFESLADDRTEVIIEYRGQQYRLRTTRHGGLILNK